MTDSMRDDLNAALDATGENYDETQQEVLTDETTETEDVGDVQAATETVEASESSETSGIDETETVEAKTLDTENESVKAENTKQINDGDSIKAPVDWGPKEREHWSKIPRHLQEKVVAREKELNTMLQTTAVARKTHEEFSGLVQQYGSVLSGVMGDTPMETTRNLFSTVANLRMGSPIQKAQIIADMVKDFGVDINTLDSALVGAAPSQEVQQTNQFDAMLDKRLAPFEQMMGQQNAFQQQQATQRTDTANAEVQAFAGKAEFLGDVRNDMADLIEMAAKRGQTMSMEEAYGKACALNPQIASVMQERHQKAQLTGNSNNMATKHLAASSVNGRQIGGGGGGETNLSLHDTISAAWDSQDRI